VVANQVEHRSYPIVERGEGFVGDNQLGPDKDGLRISPRAHAGRIMPAGYKNSKVELQDSDIDSRRLAAEAIYGLGGRRFGRGGQCRCGR
jgi:hypothetical protein